MRPLAPVEIVTPAPPATTSNGYGGEISIDEELGLRNYWRAVRKRLWLIVLLTMTITLAMAVYMARQPDSYEAYARVQVDAERANPAVTPSKTDVLTFNDPTYFSTQLQILSSSGLLRRVVKALDLEHNQAFLHPQPRRTFWQNIWQTFGFGKGKRSEAEKPTGTEALKITLAPPTQQDDLIEATQLAPHVEALQGGLEIEPVKDNRLKVTETRLIDIRFRHADPQIAAKVVNAIADTFLLSNLEMKTETNTTTGDFLQRRIAELQAQIRTGEERLVNYARNNQILSLDASQNTVVERLAGLNRQLLEAENERKAAEAAYRAALLPGAAEAQAAESQKQINDLETKLAELRQKRAQLLVEVTEEWPEVKEVSQQIAVLEKQIEQERARAVSNVKINLETRYRQALAREQSLRTAFDQQRGETLAQNEAAINYRIIQQEIETSKNLLNGLLQRSKENEVVLAGTSSNIHIVDHAIVPRSPVGPHRLLMVSLACALGLSFSIGLALVLERFNDTLRSTDEVEQLLRLPALVAIPTANSLKPRRQLALKGASSSANGNGNGNGHGRPELLINSGVHSPLAESYRHLRTSILLSTPGGVPNTLLVTSSQPSEGKTTTAANIAVSLAQTGVNVLLIDADLRRPQMHKIFHLENDRGLSTLLSRGAAAPEVLSSIRRHKASGLHVLSSGPATPNAAELLGSDQMRQLLSFLQTIFTYIIIDSPPVTSFTDGVLISSMTDGVLFVVQWGKSPREVARRARQVLQEAGARIIGVVLNNVDPKTSDEKYYDRYYSAEDAEVFERDESDASGA
ncbi:MAG TPA: polysaccharide biosynthesis tyrosine autokinase [Pyrinomonadaceae bacterium]